MDADSYYTQGVRTDDTLKVGGIYVSPFEVKGSLMKLPSLLEAAVIGVADTDGLTKPRSCVVLKSGHTVDETASWRPISTRAGWSLSASCPKRRPARFNGSSCDNGNTVRINQPDLL